MKSNKIEQKFITNHNPRVGLIALATDFMIEKDFINVIKDKEIDFLSIDVEGTEIDVLQGLDFKKYKPKLVVLEFIDFNVSEYYNLKIDSILNSSINKFMEDQNYKLVNWIHDDLVYVPNK